MAMLSNTWYTITLAALATPPYTADTYSLPPAILNLLITGTPLHVFCIFDFGAGLPATISFLGGQADVPSDAVTIATTPAMLTSTLTNGENWYSVRDTPSSWMWYADQSGFVRRLTGSGTLGAFIT